MNKNFSFIFLILFFLGCSKNSLTQNENCSPEVLKNSLNYQQLISSFDAGIFESLVREPDANGALSRNKNGYFHVRFQMEINTIANYLLYKQGSVEAIAALTKSIEYSFNYQMPTGDFQLIIPPALQYLGIPEEGDIVSGTAFFLSSLGISLMALEQNSWYKNSTQATSYKNRIEQLKPSYQKALDYLKSKKDLLSSYDAVAPNRLVFDALAYYLLGSYLNDMSAKNTGIEFAKKALALKNEKGYFEEKGGYDSSYNGVTISLLLSLITFLNENDTLKNEIWQAASCSANWQKSRILSTGEISTQGNTRVFPGGEQFLGEEKKVAFKDVVLAFFMMYYYTGKTEFYDLAKKVSIFYR